MNKDLINFWENPYLDFMFKYFFLVSVILFSVDVTLAQSVDPDVVSSAGNEYSTANTTISFTIGEVVTKTETGTNAEVTQGFHQPYYEITSIEETNDANIEVTMMSNPSTEMITLDIKGNQEDMSIVVFDLSGKKVLEQMINGSGQFDVDLSGYASAMYLINIMNSEGTFRSSHKVIKH